MISSKVDPTFVGNNARTIIDYILHSPDVHF